MAKYKDHWGSRIGLVLAMAGNAVGLGNFLRFPAQAAQNGGGAFIIPYLISFILMGIPLLWVEWAMGRHGGIHGYHATPGIMHSMGPYRWLKYVGVFGIFTNIAIAAYYSYIESWTLGYVWYSITGAFQDKSAAEVSSFFSHYLNTGNGQLFNFPVTALIFFSITLAINIWILSRGLHKGIEIASKIGMPVLVLFGLFLAIRAITLKAGHQNVQFDSAIGLNYLWQPQFSSLANPKVWLAAAGQIFFTLSLGMGCIHVYASYVHRDEDIALNAASAGWINEFVDVMLGGSIVIPIAVAYLGLDWIKANVGFEMGFRTMPTLFQNWGPLLAALAGLAWFGLLFFAGITSSLAMGQPFVTFMNDCYGIKREKAAVIFGMVILLLGLPCIFLYEAGAFSEFDYWAGTFGLVVFALLESIIFAWIFGMDRGWTEITRGADLKVHPVFRFVIKYVTPLFLLAVFFGSLLKPMAGDWPAAFTNLFGGQGWPLSPDSVLGIITNVGVQDARWFIDGHPTRTFVIDCTRLLLVAVFVAIGFGIYKGFKMKRVLHKEESL